MPLRSHLKDLAYGLAPALALVAAVLMIGITFSAIERLPYIAPQMFAALVFVVIVCFWAWLFGALIRNS